MIPVLHRKRKLSVSGRPTKETLVKKFKEEIDAEKRKKIRLEWYLKQLLLEKEMLVKENEIEFAKAMESLSDADAALAGRPATMVVPSATVPSEPIPIAAAPLSMDLAPSLLFGDASLDVATSPSSAKAYNPFFSLPPPAPLTTPTTTSTSTPTAAEDPCAGLDDPFLASLLGDDDTKPASVTTVEEPSSIFSAEWEQTHCWWADDDELSQILAVPSLMV